MFKVLNNIDDLFGYIFTSIRLQIICNYCDFDYEDVDMEIFIQLKLILSKVTL